jgi:hypothetical protein
MIRAILLAIAVLAPTRPVAAEEALIEVGQPFPLLALPVVGKEGARDSIEAYRGRKLMLHLFASW